MMVDGMPLGKGPPIKIGTGRVISSAILAAFSPDRLTEVETKGPTCSRIARVMG